MIDPATRRLTQLVVGPRRKDWVARLVPIDLAQTRNDASRAVELRMTVEEALRLPPVHDVAFMRVGDFPVDDPEWDVGIQQVLALPYYTAYDLEPILTDFAVMYDRIPKSDVEIRRASSVASAEGHHLGHVDGFVVDPDDHITHLVLERGHLWGRREVTIPIGAVARVETDAIALSLTRDEVGALPEARVQRLPAPGLRVR